MSAMRRLLVVMSCMVLTTRPTTSPPRTATSVAAPASALAWRAVSALCCTVVLSCSIDEAVCCRLPAWRSVRWLRSALPAAISPAATRTDSEASCTACSDCASRWRTCSSSPIRRPISSRPWATSGRDRSPAASWFTSADSRPMRRTRPPDSPALSTPPSTKATAVAAITVTRA